MITLWWGTFSHYKFQLCNIWINYWEVKWCWERWYIRIKILQFILT